MLSYHFPREGSISLAMKSSTLSRLASTVESWYTCVKRMPVSRQSGNAQSEYEDETESHHFQIMCLPCTRLTSNIRKPSTDVSVIVIGCAPYK